MKRPTLTEAQEKVIEDIRMLTKDQVAVCLVVSPARIDKFRSCGLLRGINTGSGWRFSREEVLNFQKDLAGIDISSEQNMLEAVKLRKFS